jgi:hypothetical protein
MVVTQTREPKMMTQTEIATLLSKFENTVDTFAGVFAQDAVIALCERDIIEVLPHVFDDGSSVSYMWTHFQAHIISLIEKKKMK